MKELTEENVLRLIQGVKARLRRSTDPDRKRLLQAKLESLEELKKDLQN